MNRAQHKAAMEDGKRVTHSRAVSDERMVALDAYVTECLSAWRLDEWVIHLKWDRRPDDSGSLAQIDVTLNRYDATLRVDEEFFSQSPEDKRMIVAHELLHLVFDPLDMPIWDGKLREVLGAPAFSLVSGGVHSATERIIDRIAVIAAATLPATPKALD